MPISATPTVLVNSLQLGGNQSGARTVALGNGDYIVAWTNSNDGTSEVMAQKFSAKGDPIGGPTFLLTSNTSSITMTDLALVSNGRLIVGAAVLGGTEVLIGQFNTATLAPAVATTSLVAAQAVTQVSVVESATSPGTIVVYTDTFVTNTITQRAVVSATGTVTTAPTTIQTVNAAQVTTRELIDTLANGEIALQSNGNLLNAAGQTRVVDIRANDLVEVQPGLLVASQGNATGFGPSVLLRGISGFGIPLASFSVSAPDTGGAIPGGSSAGTESFGAEMVDLGNGRILVIWVADAGDNFQTNIGDDGIYAAVYNTNTGEPEGTALLLQSFGRPQTANNILTDTQLSQIKISADLMPDGRVGVSMTFPMGITGDDVFTTIIDARGENLSLSATSVAETLIGSAGADTITGVAAGDSVDGGAGIDTVIFTGSTAVQMDLQRPEAIPGNTIKLTSIENLAGGNGADRFSGDGAANRLSGGSGDDTLDGRSGDDALLGDAGNDILFGKGGTDTLSGGTGFDSLSGDAGDDLLLGDQNDDLLQGGGGNDELNGGTGDDRLFGQDGDDNLFGDSGNDFLNGGQGADLLSGDVGNDTIRAVDGADTVLGGTGDDLIQIGSTVFSVDGGAGVDTVEVFAQSSELDATGVHLDLTGQLDRLGFGDVFDIVEGTFSGIENVTGTEGNDLLAGSAVANLLRGGRGNDVLQGRAGADTLVGGAGNDMFVFADANGGNDRVRDFTVGSDKIALLADGFGNIFDAGLAARVTINATATVAGNASAQLILDNAGAGAGQLFFDADGNGAGLAVLMATIASPDGGLALITVSDFTFL